MTTAPVPQPTNLIVPPGHRYINDYYGHYINNNKADDFILLGQWQEFDLYAIKQWENWSLGARYSDEGSDYESMDYSSVRDTYECNASSRENYCLHHCMLAFEKHMSKLCADQFSGPDCFVSMVKNKRKGLILAARTHREIIASLIPLHKP